MFAPNPWLSAVYAPTAGERHRQARPENAVYPSMPSHGKSVVIHLDVLRLRCKPCRQTFTASVPEIDTPRQMTERLVKWVGRQALEYTQRLS